MKIFEENEKKNRKASNNDVLKKLKSGESLTRYNVQDSWFPPRPIIKKLKDTLKIIKNTGDKNE